MTVIFHRLAEAEYDRVVRKYARQSIAAAQRFGAAVNRVVARIDANPAVGAPAFGAYRWMTVGRFRYLLYYRELSAGRILVYAVAHASRRPGYWLRRVNQP
jgi:plasmid stabilization system protein ParE